MVYIRGHAYDYDRWEKEGAEGWSYADCLPYFRKSQTHELGRCSLHFSTSYIFILGAPHPFNPGSLRNDQPHRPNIGQTGIKSLYFLSLSKAPQKFPY